MGIMIHTCPAREWYVTDFLVPSLIDQGISGNEISVWVDRDGRGNLSSCIETFCQSAQLPGETWHLQDDVIVCRDFAERIKDAPSGVVCGFCVKEYENEIRCGTVKARHMWQSSFPCIKIPNRIAGEFVEWFISSAQYREDLQKYVETGKKDDTLFFIFMLEKHYTDLVTNLTPHLVEHIDYLIGGSILNQTRDIIARSCFWHDSEIIEELQSKLADR